MASRFSVSEVEEAPDREENRELQAVGLLWLDMC